MSKCKHYDEDEGWCKKFSWFDDPMPHIVYCHKGPCEHEEKMTNYDLIKSLSKRDMAVFLTELLKENDERMLCKLKVKLEEYGIDVSLASIDPAIQLKINIDYLEREVE